MEKRTAKPTPAGGHDLGVAELVAEAGEGAVEAGDGAEAAFGGEEGGDGGRRERG